MKNTYGSAVTLTIFGESHGPAVGLVLDGIAPGIKVDKEFIAFEMSKRKAVGRISTGRQEPDRVEFLSGVHEGYTTGTSLCMIVKNTNTRSADYTRTQNLLRPGHADYTAIEKYLGYADPRGGGHFSGRLTAPLVAAGALFRQILAGHGIVLGTHLARCAGIQDKPLPTEQGTLRAALEELNKMEFAVLDAEAGDRMKQAVVDAKNGLDSVGGILETAVTGLPAGVGEPFFGSVESAISSLFFSIPAVKGIEFGLGFDFADLRGSQANDPFIMQGEKVATQTNNNGGLNGGITNGMPLVFRAVVKPTASIALPQQTVDIDKKQQDTLELHGRHDPSILHRARAVADAMTAFALVDLLTQRYGTLWQREE
ncbi:MAG: chorismate synthase [Oscillospiraceae bacterium]